MQGGSQDTAVLISRRIPRVSKLFLFSSPLKSFPHLAINPRHGDSTMVSMSGSMTAKCGCEVVCLSSIALNLPGTPLLN